MAGFNRRLLVWLLKAYVKRWGKVITISFFVGLAFFFILKQFLFGALLTLTSENKKLIGTVGSYTINSIPQSILLHASEGLTSVDETGKVKPAAASSWKIMDSGKTYVFTLKKNLYFTDGTVLTSSDIHFSYSDVTTERPNPSTVIFHLKNNYAPFLVTVSRPIFKKNFVGLGPYVLKSIKLNGSFIESMSMVTKNGSSTLEYQFYPTQDALKVAFALGEISIANGLSDTQFQDTSFEHFSNATITKSIRYDTLVTLFYNTQDSNLSNKELRDAFSYAIPVSFADGLRAYTSIPPVSWAYSDANNHTQDFAHAQLLLNAAGGAKKLPAFTLTTLTKYQKDALSIQKSLQKLGIKTKIVTTDSIPQNFQMFLGDFAVSKDPDQYTLWHSYQSDNITNLNNDKRIDKLLEDGRQTVNESDREKIYSDFQKYLADEQPATFLYFPYSYTVKRK